MNDLCCNTGTPRWCVTDSVCEAFGKRLHYREKKERTCKPPASRYVPAELLTMSTLPSPNVSRHCFHDSWCTRQYCLPCKCKRAPLGREHMRTCSSGTRVSLCGIVCPARRSALHCTRAQENCARSPGNYPCQRPPRGTPPVSAQQSRSGGCLPVQVVDEIQRCV